MTDAELQGQRAYDRGLRAHNCPYGPASLVRLQWLRGWENRSQDPYRPTLPVPFQIIGWVRRLLEIDVDGVSIGPDGFGISGTVGSADHGHLILLGSRHVPCAHHTTNARPVCPICEMMDKDRRGTYERIDNE